MKYEKEEDIRKDFARLFNWYSDGNPMIYSTKREVKIPEWAEIFSKVGALLNSNNFKNLENRIYDLEQKVIYIDEDNLSDK